MRHHTDDPIAVERIMPALIDFAKSVVQALVRYNKHGSGCPEVGATTYAYITEYITETHRTACPSFLRFT